MAWREALKKPAPKPAGPKPKFDTHDDDWETDTSYQNIVSEKSQRYGSSSVPGTGRIDHVDFKSIHEKVKAADSAVKESYQESNPNRGYGGKYGTEKVMDKVIETNSAVDYNYQPEVPKHPSQTDFKKGFGGTYGIDERAKDKSAVGFDYRAPVEKHSSQTDFSKGFGGKFGLDSNAQDKSALGFTHQESLAKHPSQKDYSVGFGGKYGIQKEEPSRLATHSSASPPVNSSSNNGNVVEKPLAPMGSSAGVGNIRARFENMKKQNEEETAKRIAEERSKLLAADQKAKAQGNGSVKYVEPNNAPQDIVHPSSPPAVSNTPEQIYENISHQFHAPHQTETEKIVGGVNVSSLLRNRRTSSSSSSSKNQEVNEDEWADDYNTNTHQPFIEERNPSSVPGQQMNSHSNGHQHEGVRCIARYSYQKVEDDELGFEENEIITHVQKSHDEWWMGRIGSRFGIFPANYVEELP